MTPKFCIHFFSHRSESRVPTPEDRALEVVRWNTFGGEIDNRMLKCYKFLTRKKNKVRSLTGILCWMKFR